MCNVYRLELRSLKFKYFLVLKKLNYNEERMKWWYNYNGWKVIVKIDFSDKILKNFEEPLTIIKIELFKKINYNIKKYKEISIPCLDY